MKSNQKKIALLMGLSLFMEMLDSTIVTTALPQIKKSINATTSSISLIISVYMIVVAICIPLSGWLAKKYGNKKIWILAITLFILSSVGSGLSMNLPILLVMRLLQGFSGALMVPTARLIVLENTPPEKLLTMISYVIWPALIAPAIAPLIGGMLSTFWTWRLIFIINVPIGFILLVIGYKIIENDNQKVGNKIRFDWLGFLLLSILSSSLLVGLDIISSRKEINLLSIILLIVFISSTFLTKKHLEKCSYPIFSLKMFRFSSYKVSQFGGNLMWLSIGAIPFLSTLYFQNDFQWSAIKTGFFVLFIFLGNIAIKPFANSIIKRIGFKISITLSLMLILVTTFLIGTFTANIEPIYIIVVLTLSGIGRSLALTAYNGMSLVEIPYEERNSANTFSAVGQNLFQGVGVSTVSICLSLVGIHQYQMNFNAYRITYCVLAIIIFVPLLEIISQRQDIGIINKSK